MKTAVSFRLKPEILAAVQAMARLENRSLTNFIETVLLERLRAVPPEPGTASPTQAQPIP
jgi:hypothetical protein